jgi:hypothetical protein
MHSGRLLSGGGAHVALSLFLRSGEDVNIYVAAEIALILEHGGSGPKDKSTI